MPLSVTRREMNILTEQDGLQSIGSNTISNLVRDLDRTAKWAAYVVTAASLGDDGIDVTDVERARSEFDPLMAELRKAVEVAELIESLRDDPTKVSEILDHLGMTYEEISAEFD